MDDHDRWCENAGYYPATKKLGTDPSSIKAPEVSMPEYVQEVKNLLATCPPPKIKTRTDPQPKKKKKNTGVKTTKQKKKKGISFKHASFKRASRKIAKSQRKKKQATVVPVHSPPVVAPPTSPSNTGLLEVPPVHSPPVVAPPTSPSSMQGLLEVPTGIPAAALPQRQRTGKFNYTIDSPCGAKVEVQLRNKCFFVKCAANKQPIIGSPNFSWSKFNTIADAWHEVEKTTQWNLSPPKTSVPITKRKRSQQATQSADHGGPYDCY